MSVNLLVMTLTSAALLVGGRMIFGAFQYRELDRLVGAVDHTSAGDSKVTVVLKDGARIETTLDALQHRVVERNGVPYWKRLASERGVGRAYLLFSVAAGLAVGLALG